MTAEIICVGTELLLGDILNTNAQFLSRELAELGISVMHQHVIGDNPARLKELVLQAKSRSDLLVFSGGLGPTEDDLTKETVAEAFGDTLAFDEGEWQKIIDFFARTNRRPTPNNRKQAMCPTVGHKLINDHGTAPGAWFEDADGHCAALMPGVPREMKAMWAKQVRPILLKRQNCTIHSRTLRVLGGESAIASKVAPLFEAANPTAAIYCKTGECEIRVTAREATVHAAAAESCTGGMIAERLTNVPGSSEVFGYGFVTYAEAAKQKLLGVDAAVIEKYNVVSGPVAAAMAFGAARESGAELAVGITGLAGPGGALPGKPVGTVYLAGADTRTDTGYLMRLTLGGYQDRQIIRTRAALYALDMLRRMALGLDVPDSVRFTPETADRDLDI